MTSFIQLLSKAHHLGAAWRRRGSSQWPVLPLPTLSVGNLAFGGRCKTPLVIDIVREAQSRGLRPGVLSRGYSRQGGRQAAPAAVPSRTRPSEQAAWLTEVGRQANLLGDEPALIAATTGCAVGVHADRVRAAETLLAVDEVDLFILDDGFQTPVQRQLDIVSLDLMRDPPFAYLDATREGTGSLKRASLAAIILPPEMAPSGVSRSNQELAGLPEGLDAMPIRRRGGRLLALKSGLEIDDKVLSRPLWLAAGVGQPESVAALMSDLGLTVSRVLPTRNHSPPHRSLLKELRESDALAVVTEKDAVGWAHRLLDDGLVLTLEIEGGQRLAARVLDGLRRHGMRTP